MAAATTDTKIFENQNSNNNNNNHEVSRQEIQAAIAKAVELRALHATLMQGNSPANLRFTSSSPVSRPASHFSAQDYPVFTPSYEDEPEDGCHQIHMTNQTLSGTWDEYGIEDGNGEETALSDYKSVAGSYADHTNLLQTSSGTKYFKTSRRNSLREFKSVSSVNKFRPEILTTESENVTRNSRNSNIVVPLTDSHSSVQSQPKNKNAIFSWLFPRLRKKHRNENSPSLTESEEVSQVFRDLGTVSIETLKKELIEANENRDAALMEVAEMKSSLGELKQKLEYLETYCEELKRALRQAKSAKDSHDHERLENLLKRVKSIDGKAENQMPVNEEVMVEGFLQVVSEARLSVKQFCKTLVAQIEETDNTLMENLNLLLQPYNQSLNSKYSKVVIYHLEAIINQSLYQNFENCVFQKNGSKKLLDPQQDRQVQFSSFVALRNLSWNEVLRKGTKYYSEEFSKFCDQKMNCIVTTLNWTKPWPEQLLQAFFVAAKCIWLLHLLAFSFNPAVGILRVEENRSFDPHYMEDMFRDRQRSQGPSKVKIMVMPGFYVQDRVLRCKVLCRYKSVA